MSLVQKIGYITIVYWSYQISLSIFYKVYQTYFSKKKLLDISSLGKWAIVTGCSRSIGKAFAEILAKQGLNLILINHPNTQDSTKDFSKNLESFYGINTKIIYLNISEGLEAYKAVENEIVDLEIGILINNFGYNSPHPEYFLDLPHNDKIYTNIINYNAVVTTNMCRIILPQMVLRRKGAIINIASSAAVIPSPLLTVYAATKAYILKFSKGLHMEYNKYGIVVQCLLPASVANASNCTFSSNSWFLPTPEQYVESAIKTIGKNEITTGFFPHSVFLWIVQLIDKFSPTLLIFAITRVMEINRNRIIQKYIC